VVQGPGFRVQGSGSKKMHQFEEEEEGFLGRAQLALHLLSRRLQYYQRRVLVQDFMSMKFTARMDFYY